MATVNLLPRKEFEITLENGVTLKGQWGTWAMKRACKKLGCKLYELGDRFAPPMLNDKGEPMLDDKGEPRYHPAEIEVYEEFLLCSIEYKARQDKAMFSYTDVDACMWIDEMGGVNSEHLTSIMKNCASESEQKKTEVQAA